MKLTVVALVVVLLLPSAAPPAGKGWRGLVPMKSTREDVKRLLGAPVSALDYREKYASAEGAVHVEYVSYRCDLKPPHGCPAAPVCRLPPHTVLSLMVELPRPAPISGLDIDLSKFEKVPDNFNSGRVFFYKDLERGVTLNVLDGMVKAYRYHPTTEDKKLFRCPKG